MSAKRVALAGATGNLGPSVLDELLNAGFNVTVLTRNGSNHKFDTRAKVAKVNYDSIGSLKSALAGHDALVNTLGTIGRDVHLRLIDAAVAAGVSRILPSEFGSDTTNPKASKLPVYADKVAVQEHLKKIARETDTSYTFVINGPFLDWGLKVKFLLGTNGQTELYDGGNSKFSTTTLRGAGRAVVGVLRNLEETKNRTVYVEEANLSQRRLLDYIDREVPTKNVATDELERTAYEELEKSDPNMGLVAINFLKRVIFDEEYGSNFSRDQLSNSLLNVKYLSEEELRNVILDNISVG
ncbi:hypothetical protein FQN50_009597 [Emmonsiellopsis sp. PD_5]|nr:hypothetical protein FQN50_009597 [Emmonsiellopsis sp. PD_5]